jgi:hypothetical protein
VKPGYVPQNQAGLARAREIQSERKLSLRDLREALLVEGVDLSIRILSQAGLAVTNGAPPAAVVPPARPTPPEGIDADGTPLEIARGMARAIAGQMAEMAKDSGPYAKLSGELRQVTKLIAALERDAAGDETPAEREARLRREDGETATMIDRYVAQALAEALRVTEQAPHGRCPTCEMALTPDARAMLGV